MTTELSVLNRDKPVSQDDTIRMLLERSKRSARAVPIRRAFIQDIEPGPGQVTKPGPFAKLLRSPAQLDLFLLIHAVTARADWGVTERSETWGRAAGISFGTDGSASAAVSRHLNKLKVLKLISTAPDGRKTRITKQLEDGSGDPYTKPSGNETGSRKDIYIKLPFEYWERNYYRTLSMPAKAMLLIVMSLRDRSVVLRQNKEFASWYGISTATVSRGMAELKDQGLLYEYLSEAYLTGDTPLGRDTRTRYALSAPFDINVKKAVRDAAEAMWTPEGVLATALRYKPSLDSFRGAVPR
ncbi:hypothetical protein ACFC5T_40120 [Streptomyces sp. NPDC055961]|uniref:hypothetical protein n=1 Tax=Streptomyces sp. NPDC055961 TaxID=3345666 RepID=UPI0035D5472C